jgi:hypothetical protein
MSLWQGSPGSSLPVKTLLQALSTDSLTSTFASESKSQSKLS